MTLRYATRILRHAVIEPALWRTVSLRRLRKLSDERFLSRIGAEAETATTGKLFSSLRIFPFLSEDVHTSQFAKTLLTTQTKKSILQEADAVLRHRFSGLGIENFELGDDIRWCRDYLHNYEWQMADPRSLKITGADVPADPKIPWEMARFHQVWPLGKAYLVTRNEKYALCWKELFEDFTRKNPVGLGVHWMVPMEAAIRTANWIAAAGIFGISPSLPLSFHCALAQSLYAHGLYIEQNLEFTRRSGNHLIACLLGLYLLGIFFKNASFATRWRRKAFAYMIEEIERQILPDGVNYEKSLAYHRFTLEMLSVFYITSIKNGDRIGPRTVERLKHQFEFLRDYTRPDRTAPVIGDADDGRLFRYTLGDDPQIHDHLLPIGTIALQLPELLNPQTPFSQDALFLLGVEGRKSFDDFSDIAKLKSSKTAPPAKEPLSAAYREGGFYILRSNDFHIVADAGELGKSGWGGHGHNDTLSFELWAYGIPWIIDCGSPTYMESDPLRLSFRNTTSHNMVVVDGAEIADFEGNFRIKDRTEPEESHWETEPGFALLKASHSGYMRLPHPVKHTRKFEFNSYKKMLVIADQLQGAGKRNIDIYFHLSPFVAIRRCEKTLCTVAYKKIVLSIQSTQGQFSTEDGLYSPSYGIRMPSTILRLSLRHEIPIVITTKLHFTV